MKHAPIVIAALLASGMAMSPDAISAGPRDPRPAQTDAAETPEEVRARKTQDMEAWLRRLVGRFIVYPGVSATGVMRPAWWAGQAPDGLEVTRVWDCIGIGSGPGVHCMAGRIVQEQDQLVMEGLAEVGQGSYHILLGINPNASEIQIFYAAGRNINEAWTGSARLHDDTATWRMLCNASAIFPNCGFTVKITAPANGEYTHFTVSGELTGTQVYLLPVPEDESSAADGPARIPSKYSDSVERSKRLRRPR